MKRRSLFCRLDMPSPRSAEAKLERAVNVVLPRCAFPMKDKSASSSASTSLTPMHSVLVLLTEAPRDPAQKGVSAGACTRDGDLAQFQHPRHDRRLSRDFRPACKAPSQTGLKPMLSQLLTESDASQQISTWGVRAIDLGVSPPL